MADDTCTLQVLMLATALLLGFVVGLAVSFLL